MDKKSGNIARIKDKKGVQTEYYYNNSYKLRYKIEAKSTPLETHTEYSYSHQSKIPTTIAIKGVKGSPSSVTINNYLNDRGQIIKQRYNYWNMPESAVDQTLQFQYYENPNKPNYGLLRRYDQMSDKVNDNIYFTYDKYGNLASKKVMVEKPRDKKTKSYVKSFGGYNSAGKPLMVKDFDNLWTQYSYDASGVRVVKTTVGKLIDGKHVAGRTSRSTYDAVGRLLNSYDAYGAAVNRYYDSMGRLIKSTSPDGSYVTYSYFPNGMLENQKAYNKSGTLQREQSQGMDANGRVAWEREGSDRSRRGKTITMMPTAISYVWPHRQAANIRQ